MILTMRNCSIKQFVFLFAHDGVFLPTLPHFIRQNVAVLAIGFDRLTPFVAVKPYFMMPFHNGRSKQTILVKFASISN